MTSPLSPLSPFPAPPAPFCPPSFPQGRVDWDQKFVSTVTDAAVDSVHVRVWAQLEESVVPIGDVTASLHDLIDLPAQDVQHAYPIFAAAVKKKRARHVGDLLMGLHFTPDSDRGRIEGGKGLKFNAKGKLHCCVDRIVGLVSGKKSHTHFGHILNTEYTHLTPLSLPT